VASEGDLVDGPRVPRAFDEQLAVLPERFDLGEARGVVPREEDPRVREENECGGRGEE